MNEIMTMVGEIIQPAALILIETTLALAVPFLALKILAWSEAKVGNARFGCAMDKVTRFAEIAVLDVGNQYVKDVRKNGSWSGKSAAQAKDRARSILKDLLGPAGLKELQSCLGRTPASLAAVTDGAIERAVTRGKLDGSLMEGGHSKSTE